MGVDLVAAAKRSAAAPVLKRIRRDRQQAPKKLKPLLEYLEQHLFESDLNVERLRRACHIRDRSVTTYFGEVFGDTLKLYIETCRLETAARLLRDSTLTVSQIAKLVGYSALSVFSRAFDRWAGQRPREYRQQSLGQNPPPSTEDDLLSSRFWRRAVLGQLEDRQAIELLDFLAQLYPAPALASKRSASALEARESDEEQRMAERLWQRLAGLPIEQQRECVRYQLGFRTHALFRLLLDKSKTEGRKDVERGVEIAELAHESLKSYGSSPGSELPNLTARAWAWLGRARRMAMDLDGAETAFQRAENFWASSPVDRDPKVLAEIWLFVANLRTVQYRYDEALELINRALPLFIEADDPTSTMQARLQRAYILCFAGTAEAAIRELQATLIDLETRPDTYLELSAHSLLVSAYIIGGQFDLAFTELENLKKPVAALGHPTAVYRLQWMEGLALWGQGRLGQAESALLGAQEGLAQSGPAGHTDAAGVSLDLAILYYELGAAHRAVPLVDSALLTLQACRLSTAAVKSLMLLREAVAEEKRGLANLRRVRDTLQSILLLPPVGPRPLRR